MIFYCKNCNKEIKVNDKKAKGFYNWKCPICKNIILKKDILVPAIIWKCETGTVKRRIK